MRKFAVVLYVRNRGSTGLFYPWSTIVEADSRGNAHVKAIAEANRYHTEVHSVYSVLDVPDSVG